MTTTPAPAFTIIGRPIPRVEGRRQGQRLGLLLCRRRSAGYGLGEERPQSVPPRPHRLHRRFAGARHPRCARGRHSVRHRERPHRQEHQGRAAALRRQGPLHRGQGGGGRGGEPRDRGGGSPAGRRAVRGTARRLRTRWRRCNRARRYSTRTRQATSASLTSRRTCRTSAAMPSLRLATSNQGFREADVVVEREYVTPALAPGLPRTDRLAGGHLACV